MRKDEPLAVLIETDKVTLEMTPKLTANSTSWSVTDMDGRCWHGGVIDTDAAAPASKANHSLRPNNSSAPLLKKVTPARKALHLRIACITAISATFGVGTPTRSFSNSGVWPWRTYHQKRCAVLLLKINPWVQHLRRWNLIS